MVIYLHILNLKNLYINLEFNAFPHQYLRHILSVIT